jgi:hypothetical protein
MGRIVFFIALGLLAVVLFKSWQRKQGGLSRDKTPRVPRAEGENVIACLHCKAFAPQSEGVMIQGRFYCQNQHAVAAGERLDSN